VTVANAPGTIDAGYRGEVLVLLVNLGEQDVELAAGERVAQLLLQQVGRAEVVEVASLDQTVRGSGGFGSTGR
jgi:dUTP pyrophosphatase